MKDYINDYGLINAKLADINAENAPLFTMEYILMNEGDEFLEKLLTFTQNSHTGTHGLYNQSPKLYGNLDDYMSPDQLIAFIGALILGNRPKIISNIWSYLVRHAFTYDNTKPNTINFKRTIQPSVVLFVGVAAGKWYLKPLLSLACVIACKSSPTQTSGKLKAWVMFKVLKMKRTEKICNYIISKNKHLKSWTGVFLEYFKEENNPIRKQVLKGLE